jgi:hypothetical protein
MHQALVIRAERVALVAGMVLATTNIWTGAPLLGLLVGSLVAPSSGISMLAVAAIALTTGAACYALVRVLAVLGAAHDRLTGHETAVRRHTPWLRSLSGERPHESGGTTPPLNALEYVLVGGVVVAVLLFEAWFLFFSTSPLDGRSGR